MGAAVTNILTEILAVVRDEKESLAAVVRPFAGGVMESDPKPSSRAETKIRQALVDLENAGRESVLHLLFPKAAAPTGTTMDPMQTEDLRCRCGVCRLCWERELVAAAREDRAPERPEAVL